MDVATKVRSELADILSFVEKHSAPTNEQATCDYVIRPLLEAAGYSKWEIEPQGADLVGKKPDYTVLPGLLKHRWYLEAKAWKANLTTQDVAQAMNYAHQNGSRWVVLTNGREWRLYDDTIPNTTNDQRLMVQARVEDQEDLVSLLTALGRESVTTGAMAQYAEDVRLQKALLEGFRSPDGHLLSLIVDVLRGEPGLSGLTVERVAQHIGRGETAEVLKPEADSSESVSYGASWLTLPQLIAHGVTGRKPSAVRLADTLEKSVGTWKEALASIAEDALGKALPPLPWTPGKKGVVLANSPDHMRSPLLLSNGLYIETH